MDEVGLRHAQRPERRSRYEFATDAHNVAEHLLDKSHVIEHDPPTRHYDTLLAAFVAVLLCANLMGTKATHASLCWVGGCVDVAFGAGTLFFPFSYLLGDVTVEVYGMRRARRMLLHGFAALLFAATMSWVIVALPPAGAWKGQREFEFVFGGTLRVGVASIAAYMCGEFLNVILFQRLRDRTNGRHLWARLVFSTVVGAAVDSAIFYPFAFYGAWDTDLLLRVMGANYAAKVMFEVAALPFSYWIVAKLKREEGLADTPSPTTSDREDGPH